MKSRLTISAGLVLFLTLLAGAQVIETRMAPDFTLPDIEGKIVTFSKNIGQGPVYVSFWATWCKPCMEELKIVERLYEKYKGQGFKVYAINTEGPKAAAKIKSFVKSYGLTFNILLDNDGEVFRRTFKGTNQPYTVIADAKGKMIFSRVGFKPGDEVEIEKLITSNLLHSAIAKDSVSTDTSAANSGVDPKSE